MNHTSWPTFSFTEVLRPPDGWQVEHAILATYSADLVVVVTSLLALTGCDLEYRRTGSRVELVKAIEALRGRVRIVAQANRVAIPSKNRPILKLLDNFLAVVDTDEQERSWHPKVALIRYRRTDDKKDRQWRVWIGSRNLTHALNWEAGLTLTSRADKGGQTIPGLAEMAATMASRANLSGLGPAEIQYELGQLTWECPPGCEVKGVTFLGPGLAQGFPDAPADTKKVIIISPFLDSSADSSVVQAAAQWGDPQTERILVSTASALQKIWETDADVFRNFTKVCTLGFPELPVEGTEILTDEAPSEAAEIAEGEELPPTGLHAKMILASGRAGNHLWIGSANATSRAWEGRNFEVMAETRISRDTADALVEFTAEAVEFKPSKVAVAVDPLEKSLEQARKRLSQGWNLQQQVKESETWVVASKPPPLDDLDVRLEVAPIGGAWTIWPNQETRLLVSGLRCANRSNLLQVRLSSGDRMSAWLQMAPCDPPPDEMRDRAIIAQYLDPRTFLLWVRSLLANDLAHPPDADWDEDTTGAERSRRPTTDSSDAGILPTVEEILRAWARDENSFRNADEKVRVYLTELETRAAENHQPKDVELLQTFRKTWNTLAGELR